MLLDLDASALGFSLKPGMWRLPRKRGGSRVIPVQTEGVGLG